MPDGSAVVDGVVPARGDDVGPGIAVAFHDVDAAMRVRLAAPSIAPPAMRVA